MSAEARAECNIMRFARLHGMGIVPSKNKKHGGIDHAYRSFDFCQSRAPGREERRTDLEGELRAVDDSTAWLPFREAAQVN